MQAFSDDLTHHHIIDPRTGYSSPQLASATVITRPGATADALSTTLMVVGPATGARLIESLPNTEALMVTKDLRTVKTSGYNSLL
jgi:thiamine biosynthesis lipoprotein